MKVGGVGAPGSLLVGNMVAVVESLANCVAMNSMSVKISSPEVAYV